ncbi:MAG: ABC transporter ATP-binding protein [Hespellia sp.]|nr:ABC transporter ATP-binding protein [Hespellia sp.]
MRKEEFPVLQLEHVTFRYYENAKRNILDDVSLSILAGGITVLMGSSGCGKSTLAAVSCGLLPENGGYLEQGEILLYGKNLAEMNQSRRAAYVTMMFQNPDLQFCMDTLRKEMQFCLENICVPSSEMDSRIEKAVRELGVEELLDKKLHSLSGGEKQKAALCCLYVMESKCMILDEPFANIDEEGTRELIQLLTKMKKLRNQTIIVIDHRMKHWLDIVDEMILLGEGGKVLARGITRENIEECYPLFQKEGVFYPGVCQRTTPVRNMEMAACHLDQVSILVEAGRGRWKRKDRRRQLLHQVNVRFPKGAMTAILGPSGCGKTTLFLAMLRQISYEGNIQFGEKAWTKKEQFQHMGIVFQNPANQFITQNVRQEVESSIMQWNPGIKDEECACLADRMMEEYGLLRFHRYSPYMLSQGQQRRLAVLSVLAGKQNILLLDEPTYGQDYRSTTAIMEQLTEKIQKDGLTVIFTTHDEELAHAWADKIYRVQEQKLQEEMI